MAFLLIYFSLALINRASAHGGGAPRLVDVEAGPYRLYVWSKPEPLRVGDAHFTIGVFEPALEGLPDKPVLDATVEVVMIPVSLLNLAPWSGLASREASANPIYYEADFTLPAPGAWRAELIVSGPAGSGSADFEMTVLPPAINWALIGGGAAIAMAAGWWFWNSRARPNEI